MEGRAEDSLSLGLPSKWGSGGGPPTEPCQVSPSLQLGGQRPLHPAVLSVNMFSEAFPALQAQVRDPSELPLLLELVSLDLVFFLL